MRFLRDERAIRTLVTCALLGIVGVARAEDPITVGSIEVDPPTPWFLGFSVTIQNGDDNYDAEAAISYRELGATEWRRGLPLLRVRPETMGTEDPPEDFGLPRPAEQFAGAIFELQPDTEYEARIEVSDPDGGGVTQIVSARTRALPAQDNTGIVRTVTVSDSAEVNAALAEAQPGDLILLEAGTYSGPLVLTRSGTAEHEIVLRGSSRDEVVVNAAGSEYGISLLGAHLRVEDLTVRNSEWGARVHDTSDIVIRRSRFTSVSKGIDGTGGINRRFYICDNVLEGGVVFPDQSVSTWNLEGIVVTGQSHVVCYNTLSGFGDALGLSFETSIPNISIDFRNNEILWSGDDGIEFDFAHRNVRAYQNRFNNCANGISMQPVWGGPVYAVRNVIYNTARGPYKLNNDPSGLLFLHNTSVRTGHAWTQYSDQVANFQLANNIIMGSSSPVEMSSEVVLGEIDYNGWYPDGVYRFDDSWSNFEALRADSPYENHGTLLDLPVFQDLVAPLDDHTTFRAPADITLDETSNAVDAGRILDGINDAFVGSAPDLGAWERGALPPSYGARVSAPAPPPTPTELSAK